jgi:hypothetical protein
MGGHHHHHHEPGHDHPHDHGHGHHHHGPGHNHAQPPRRPAQWQTPHLPDAPAPDAAPETDLDLVEAAFLEGFSRASDPISFLRVAQIPFEAQGADGHRLVLLRVESGERTDVGSVMPHLGGGGFRYDPLTAKMSSRRRELSFVYFDGHELRPLSLAEVRGLPAP